MVSVPRRGHLWCVEQEVAVARPGSAEELPGLGREGGGEGGAAVSKLDWTPRILRPFLCWSSQFGSNKEVTTRRN